MRGGVLRKRESGSTMAEFAIVAGFFFMMIFAVIEFGRLLYTHNALTDAARRGARYAVLHGQNAPCVPNVVVYGETHINAATCAPNLGASPLIHNLAAANISVTYQGEAPNGYGTALGSATVTIQNYQFTLSIPFARQTFTMPTYTSTLTGESAGFVPPDI